MTSTGWRRPETSITGASSKACENAAVSMVAEVMTMRRPGRRKRSWRRCPSRKSMLSERSWASSMMMVSYSRSRGSPCSSARSMPSVRYLMIVCGEV